VRLQLHDGSAARLAEVQRIALDLAESVTILSAPPAWKQGLDIWGATPAGLEVMTEIREQFDPKRTLNPGRFAGFL
jgi:glycolate oxidase FAD binding subunit